MSRNKYPEETVKRIVQVSMRLFTEKGYEHTSIQDIINELGGLTKGAIYHHFKSKDEILMAVAEEIYKGTEQFMKEIRDDPALTGLQKLQKMFRSSLENPSQDQMFLVAPNLLKNPRFLAIQIQSTFEETVPFYVQPVIEQGIKDGSIQTDFPKELAEFLMVLSNVWVNPMVIASSPADMVKKCRFFQLVLLDLGIDLIDDQMLDRFEQYAQIYARTDICAQKNDNPA